MSEEDRLPPAIFLMGPTACGKTALAVELVQALPLEIISVDSALVYRGLDIGTAKPGPEVLRRAPHHLIDILDASEAYSAARFREDALAAMEQITKAGRVPLLVGGTNLYFRALEFGLASLPSADPQLRAEIEARAGRLGWEALHAELAEVDPEAAARIHPNDPQRLQRALEVHALTGRPLSELQREETASCIPYRLLKLGLMPGDRSQLHERIALRFEGMLAAGLVEEVARLRAREDLDLTCPSMRSVGYRQIWQHLDGDSDLGRASQRAVTATRQLAKRQMTWLRHYPGVRLLPAEGPDTEALMKLIRAFVGQA